jgi:superfamily I DNA/RNA helicase
MGQFALEDHFQKADKNRTNTDALSGTEILNVLHGLVSTHASLQEFSNWLREQRDAETKRDPRSNTGDKADEVLVQTIHKVKGEEFMCVALFHVNENVMPHKLAKETNSESDIEEERRVCYVGVTRASEELLVTATSSDVSRFVAELAVPRGTHTATESKGESSNQPNVQVEAKPRSKTLLGSILDFISELLRG